MTKLYREEEENTKFITKKTNNVFLVVIRLISNRN